MDRGAWRRFSRHLAAHATLYIFLLVLVVMVTVTVRFPVYFRADDVHYLRWAAANANPLSAFGLSESAHDGTFRPLNLLTWWFCYRLSGLNPVAYQLTVGLAFGMSFVFLFKLVELVFSRRAAVFSLLAYIAIFSKLTFIIFWFSDMTFALEVFLINLSLYLLASAALREIKWLPWGVLAYIGASLAKEPATLIVPAVATALLATRWTTMPGRHRRKVVAVFLTMLLIGISRVLGMPILGRREELSLSMGLPAIGAFLASRLRFYGAELLSGGGVVVWIASFHLALVGWARHRRIVSGARYYLLPSLAVAGALLAAALPPQGGFVLLCLSFALILASRAPASAAAVWAAIPLIGILTVSMMTRAYLVEASFGLAVLVGVAAAEFGGRSVSDLRRLRPVFGVTLRVVLVALLCVAVFAEGPAFRARLHALSVVSAVRQNFRDAVLFTRDHLDAEGHHLIVIDYHELGIDYIRDVRGATDAERVHRQKTMSSWEVHMLLRLHGAEHVEVHDLRWFRERGDGELFFMAMNRGEREHILALGLDLDLSYEVERLGEGAWIYHLVGGM